MKIYLASAAPGTEEKKELFKRIHVRLISYYDLANNRFNSIVLFDNYKRIIKVYKK